MNKRWMDGGVFSWATFFYWVKMKARSWEDHGIVKEAVVMLPLNAVDDLVERFRYLVCEGEFWDENSAFWRQHYLENIFGLNRVTKKN